MALEWWLDDGDRHARGHRVDLNEVGHVRLLVLFFSSRRRHTRFDCDWSSDVCSSDLAGATSRARAPCAARSTYACVRGGAGAGVGGAGGAGGAGAGGGAGGRGATAGLLPDRKSGV